MKIRNDWPHKLRNLVAQPGVGQIKKTRWFLGGLVIWATTRLVAKTRAQMPTHGPTSKFGFFVRGLIYIVYAIRQLGFVASEHRHLLAKGLRVVGSVFRGSGRNLTKK